MKKYVVIKKIIETCMNYGVVRFSTGGREVKSLLRVSPRSKSDPFHTRTVCKTQKCNVLSVVLNLDKNITFV